MRVAVIFGCGSSIDRLPYRFFRWAEKQTATFAMNGAVQSTRFHEVGFRPAHYCAWDAYSEDIERQLPMIDKLKEWAGQGTKLYLGGAWPILSERPSMVPVKFTAEWAAHIAARDLKCNHIVLVGCEGHGPHHRMLNGWTHDLWINGPPKVKVEGLRQLYKLAIKYAKNCAPESQFYTWPADSVLYPNPITRLFMVDKLFEHDAGWCKGSISGLSPEDPGSTPGPATKTNLAGPGVSGCEADHLPKDTRYIPPTASAAGREAATKGLLLNGVAQLEEQQGDKPHVAGSNPAAVTIQESTLGAALGSQEPSDTAAQRTINPEVA